MVHLIIITSRSGEHLSASSPRPFSKSLTANVPILPDTQETEHGDKDDDEDGLRIDPPSSNLGPPPHPLLHLAGQMPSDLFPRDERDVAARRRGVSVGVV